MFRKRRLHQAELNPLSFGMSYNIGAGGNTYMGGMGSLGSGFSSWTPSGGYLYAAPLWLGRGLFIKQYGFIVDGITTGGADFAFGIYEDTDDRVRDYLYPGRKVDQGNITNVTVTGFYSKTLATPLPLRANKLYWGVLMKNTVGTMTLKAPYPSIRLWGLSDDATSVYGYRSFSYNNGWTATLPDPFPDVGADSTWGCFLFFREVNQNGA